MFENEYFVLPPITVGNALFSFCEPVVGSLFCKLAAMAGVIDEGISRASQTNPSAFNIHTTYFPFREAVT